MTRLEGEPLAREIRTRAEEAIRALARPPRVVVLHNAQDSANRSYRRQQAKTFPRYGVRYELEEFDPAKGPEALAERLRALSRDDSVTGIAVDQPLPAGFDARAILASVDPCKDIEATHPANLGALLYGGEGPRPAAAAAAVELARHARPSLRGLDAVVIGRSAMVGRPIALMLLAMGRDAPTVTVCHTASRDVAEHARRADVLFVAAGRAGLVRGSWVRRGAVVVDVGIHAADGRICGDVAFEEVAEVAEALTPVPGGVGPVAQAVLLENVARCARMQEARL